MTPSTPTLRRVDWLADTITRHKAGSRSVSTPCARRIRPSCRPRSRRPRADGGYVLIEATSNQVDQFGGYTGMRPAEFRDLVLGIADRCGFARDRVVLGGDHLGPNRWQRETAEVAMEHAEVLIAAYVEAGFTKIHLDCSMTLRRRSRGAGRRGRRGPQRAADAGRRRRRATRRIPGPGRTSSAPRCRYPAVPTRRWIA